MLAADDERLTFIPMSKATTPRDGQCLVDYWWTVHPVKGLVFWQNVPQCNLNREVTSRLSERLYPWAQIEQVPIVYLGHE